MQELQPPSILNIGETGGGKTTAIATLLEAGLKVYLIVTEPTGLESLLDAIQKKKLPIENLHYHVVTPSRADFGGLLEQAKRVSISDFDSLSKQKPSGNRQDSRLLEVIAACKDFTCDRTGQAFGPITSLSDDAAFGIDSLSGLNLMAMDLTIGDKLSAHQGEWGVAMNMLQKFLITCTSDLKCFFFLTAHMEQEQDELTGARKTMVSTLGRKLAPTIPRYFSEVVASYREGQSFYWSTDMMNVVLKRRSLPLGSKLEPSYVPIVNAYRERKKSIQLVTKEAEPEIAKVQAH
jgi:hypothetical protein